MWNNTDDLAARTRNVLDHGFVRLVVPVAISAWEATYLSKEAQSSQPPAA